MRGSIDDRPAFEPEFERKLAELFVRGCDPYLTAATVLFAKPFDEVTLQERDVVKSVFMRILLLRHDFVSELEVLRRASNLFHEIGSSLAADALIADTRNAKLAEKLRENQRSPDQLRSISADGFELCVRALAAAGAPDVTIHECGTSAAGEEPWEPSEP